MTKLEFFSHLACLEIPEDIEMVITITKEQADIKLSYNEETETLKFSFNHEKEFSIQEAVNEVIKKFINGRFKSLKVGEWFQLAYNNSYTYIKIEGKTHNCICFNFKTKYYEMSYISPDTHIKIVKVKVDAEI